MDPAAAGFADYLGLGLRHIISGHDHLLFLVGLLVACERWRSLVVIVSSFTLGHSITLALATLGGTPPPALVEPLIAASILWVGLENILRRGVEPPLAGRALVTVAFGLAHGLGFAGVMRELGVGTDGRSPLLPLFAFNLGVEAGQLGFAGLAWPLLRLARRAPPESRRTLPAISLVVALAGAYWLAERLWTT